MSNMSLTWILSSFFSCFLLNTVDGNPGPVEVTLKIHPKVFVQSQKGSLWTIGQAVC